MERAYSSTNQSSDPANGGAEEAKPYFEDSEIVQDKSAQRFADPLAFAQQQSARRDAEGDLAKIQEVISDEYFRSSSLTVKRLALAYILYLHLAADGEAWKKVKDHALLTGCKRRPKGNSAATQAVKIVLKSKTATDDKVCSDYAMTLVWAAAHRVEPEDFETALSQTNASACRTFVRKLRAEAKGRVAVAKPHMTLTIIHSDRSVSKLRVTLQHPHRLREAFGTDRDFENEEQLLNELSNTIRR